MGRFFKAVPESVPALYPLLSHVYSKPSVLLFGHTLIKSATGLEKGDPSALALFFLAIDDPTILA